jgi:hypothetical protein
MKKHAFKRITAMVLVFVMCVFLMPTNSLGVKAVTADDVLVEESQVSSEIGAENPTSEVEVITSEEEAPLDILSENGTILLDEATTEEWTLSYGEATETYASFDEVSAAIDALNNAEGVYTITCVKADEEGFGYIRENFPTKAAELIFDKGSAVKNLKYDADEYISTDIKLTFNTYVTFSSGCDLKEVILKL